jgi:hypothetical protein
MAAKKTVDETTVEETKATTKTTSKSEVAEFKSNLIDLANVLIKQVRNKQTQDPAGTLGRIVDIYNAVK